ncbi:MAG: 2-dehydropantoate 2-reductase [Candidatus Omnitrophica bacterium]|nr:2-dehydropantoate 2-reductase [Candidatus Omnitrophota bacterium]
MKIAIVGPGALGLLLATHLARTKNEIWVLDKNADRAKKLSEDGVRIENGNTSSRVKVSAVSDCKDIGTADIIMICVKCYDTEGALKNAKALIGEKTYILSLQNGLGNLQLISEFVDNDKIIGGVTYHGATLVNDVTVRHTGKGETIIGQENGKVLGEIRDIAAILTKAGFSTKITKDINSVIWSKLVINVGINAPSAITRLKNGALVENEYTREIMRRAVSEAVKVAKRKKAKLTYDDPIQKVEAVCRATADNLSSMLQDVIAGELTEIDYINGAIVRQAKSLNIKTPTNEMLVELVKSIEMNYKNIVEKVQ